MGGRGQGFALNIFSALGMQPAEGLQEGGGLLCLPLPSLIAPPLQSWRQVLRALGVQLALQAKGSFMAVQGIVRAFPPLLTKSVSDFPHERQISFGPAAKPDTRRRPAAAQGLSPPHHPATAQKERERVISGVISGLFVVNKELFLSLLDCAEEVRLGMKERTMY